MDNITAILCAISGAFISGIFVIVHKLVDRHFKRKDENKDGVATLKKVIDQIDKLSEKVEKVDETVKGQGRAQRVFMYDRLNYLLKCCIEKSCVPFGLRSDINELYESYKNDLHANGDLESLMVLFRQLPIEEGTKHEN